MRRREIHEGTLNLQIREPAASFIRTIADLEQRTMVAVIVRAVRQYAAVHHPDKEADPAA